MPLYEGIALIQEKQAVVLDLGTDYTKFGFTGESAPRCIVPSQFWCPRERRMRQVHDYKTTEQLYDNLVNMLHVLYFRHVLVNPKERRVVVVESQLAPTVFRETLAKVLYGHYEVSGVVWADSPRLCAVALGVGSVLVVSVGAREAEVSAVLHAILLTHATHSHSIGAHLVHSELARLLDEDNQTQLNLPHDIIEDIKVKTCFVGSRSRALQWEGEGECPAGARGVRYGGAGAGARGPLLVSGRTRERAAEPLFHRDGDQTSLADLVLQTILRCPRDARRPLAGNILVTGGTAALPGFKARLAEEIRHLAAQPPYSTLLHIGEFKFHTAPAHDNYVAWLGAAIVGASDAGARATSRDHYTRMRRLRDWSDLRDNTPPHHPHWQEQGL